MIVAGLTIGRIAMRVLRYIVLRRIKYLHGYKIIIMTKPFARVRLAKLRAEADR